MPVRSPTLVLATGIGLDVSLLDPPNALHPVAWIGGAVNGVERVAPQPARARRAFGLFAALALPIAVFEGVRRIQRAAGAHWSVAASLLALASSHRTLFVRVSEVAAALDADDLPAGRELLGHHLVSRDSADLDRSEVSAAAIESLAENLSDGVIAPWLWFAVGGAPLVWAYRTSNTLDAMWGYRTERYEDLGKAAAYLDDAWNLLPARLTALAIGIASTSDRRSLDACRIWRRDARRTVSPNAGHPMAALAGALDVRLEKRGKYVLNEAGRRAEPADIRHGLRVARRASALTAVALVAVVVAREPRA